MADNPKSGGVSNTPAQRTDKSGKIRCLLDWLGFTFLPPEREDLDEEARSIKGYTFLDDVLRFFYDHLQISFTDWLPGRQNYEGYANSLTFENINIYFDGAVHQGFHVDITGQGCRYVELIYQKLRVQKSDKPMYWYDLILALRQCGVKFTRIDIAIDDFAEYFTVPYIFGKLINGELTSKFKSWSPDGNFGMDGKAKTGMSLYFGSDQSRFQVLMYEKAKQLGLDNTSWTRTELRFKHERAGEFIEIILANFTTYRHFDLGVLAAGVLKDYITFRDPNPKDSNKRRWKVSPFWSEFLEGMEPLRLTSALPDRSVLRMASWFKQQVSKSFVIMHLAFRGINDDWEDNMIKAGLKKLTPRDIEIAMEYRRLFDTDAILKLDSAIDITNEQEKSPLVYTSNEHPFR